MSDVNGVKQTRKERAALTRRRIIAAAAEEFVRSGYHGTSMAVIAKRAGYAVQTVYLVFHTKAELFAAALDTAVLGPEGKPPLDQNWARDAVGDLTDPRATIRAFIQGGAQIYERAAALSEVARAAAPTDPDAFAVYQSREELRIRGYRDFMTMLADVLPSNVDPDRATDILITMTSSQLYLAFRQDRGWSHRQTVDWMTATIPDLVLQA